MSNKVTNIWAAALILAALVISLALFSSLPAEMISHWNASGQPDGSTSRTSAVFLVPGMMVMMNLILMGIPLIDPLKHNIDTFRSSYNILIVVINVYMLYIHLVTLLWNLGLRVDMNLLLAPAMGVLFYAAARLMEKAKRNWFIGVRTPWTLSSDTVWEKTHRRAALIFKGMAALMLLMLVLPGWFLLILIVPIFAAMIYLVIYSYVLFRQEKKPAE